MNKKKNPKDKRPQEPPKLDENMPGGESVNVNPDPVAPMSTDATMIPRIPKKGDEEAPISVEETMIPKATPGATPTKREETPPLDLMPDEPQREKTPLEEGQMVSSDGPMEPIGGEPELPADMPPPPEDAPPPPPADIPPIPKEQVPQDPVTQIPIDETPVVPETPPEEVKKEPDMKPLDEGEIKDQAKEKTVAKKPKAGKLSTKGKSSSKFKPARMPAAPPSSGARKMAYMFLFETVIMVAAIGLCIYLLMFKIEPLKKEVASSKDKVTTAESKAEKLQTQLTTVTEEKDDAEKSLAKKTKDYETAENDKIAAEEERDEYKDKYETTEDKLNELVQVRRELDEKLREAEDKVKPLEVTVTEVRSKYRKISKDYDDTLEKLQKAEKDNRTLALQIEALKEQKEEVKRKYNENYDTYAPHALGMIADLKDIHDSLLKGMDVREFVRKLDLVAVSMDEFRIQVARHSELFSFQLILAAFDAYDESKERWVSLSKSNLPKDLEGFKDKIIKYEHPVQEYRPWIDMTQINWYIAQLYFNSAKDIITAREDFKIENCATCEGKHFIACPKCSGSGECLACMGQGIDLRGDETTCKICEGFAKCVLCAGKTSIICPVSLTFTKSDPPEQE